MVRRGHSGGRLRQQIGDEDDEDGDRSKILAQEINKAETPVIEPDRPTIGKLIPHIGLTHLPPHKHSKQKSTKSHQEIGSQLITKIENRIPKQMHPMKRPERQRTQSPKHPRPHKNSHSSPAPSKSPLLNQIRHTHLKHRNRRSQRSHQHRQEEKHSHNSTKQWHRLPHLRKNKRQRLENQT